MQSPCSQPFCSKTYRKQVGAPYLSLVSMSWVRVGDYWGYGDRYPRLVILADSIYQVRGRGGWADACPIAQWAVGKTMAISTLIVAYSGARVGQGDYLRMAMAVAEMRPEVVLAISMGNDLYGRGAIDSWAIAEGLRKLCTVLPDVHFIYGGSAAVWGYSNENYDKKVREVCELLGCQDGSAELFGVATVDSIGHLNVNSVPQLCKATVLWSKKSVKAMLSRARL